MTRQELLDFIQEQVGKLNEAAADLGVTEVISDGLAVFVRFPLLRENKTYVMKCLYHDNGDQLVPGVSFVNPETLADEGARNWPRDRYGALKVTNNPPFICIPGVYEYHYQFHKGAPIESHHLQLINTVSDILGLLAK